MRNTNAKGFTLVELLAVILIIAVLIAMLLPALGAARQSAYMVGCESNLGQIGAAAQMYEQTWRDYVPNQPGLYFKNTVTGVINNVTWDKQLYDFLSSRRLPPADMASGGALPRSLALPVFICPDDPRLSYFPAAYLSYAIVRGTFGYRLGGIYVPDNWNNYHPYAVRVDAVPDPSGEIYITDAYAGGYPFQPGGWPFSFAGDVGPYQGAASPPNFLDQQYATWYNDLVIPPHSGGTFNYLFLDGHVENLHYAQTIGNGSLLVPKGMWTFAPGD